MVVGVAAAETEASELVAPIDDGLEPDTAVAAAEPLALDTGFNGALDTAPDGTFDAVAALCTAELPKLLTTRGGKPEKALDAVLDWRDGVAELSTEYAVGVPAARD